MFWEDPVTFSRDQSDIARQIGSRPIPTIYILKLFIAAFWNWNNTVTNNTAQNNNTKEKSR